MTKEDDITVLDIDVEYRNGELYTEDGERLTKAELRKLAQEE